MDLLKQVQRMQYIDELICTKRATSLEDLAKKTNVSVRQVLHTISLMKDLGAPIKYSRSLHRFYYEENKKLVFRYE